MRHFTPVCLEPDKIEMADNGPTLKTWAKHVRKVGLESVWKTGNFGEEKVHRDITIGEEKVHLVRIYTPATRLCRS